MGGLLSMWLGFSLVRSYNLIEFVSLRVCQKRREYKEEMKLRESKLSNYKSNGVIGKTYRRKNQNINKWHKIKPKISNLLTQNINEQIYDRQMSSIPKYDS